MRNNCVVRTQLGGRPTGEGRQGTTAAGMEGSMEPLKDPARSPRLRRITAGFRMSAAGPCRTAGLPEADKTDDHGAYGCAAVALALGVRIGRQRWGGGLSDRVESLGRGKAEPGDDQQGRVTGTVPPGLAAGVRRRRRAERRKCIVSVEVIRDPSLRPNVPISSLSPFPAL